MTGSDLVALIASRFPDLMAKDAATALKAILHAIGHALSQGERVEIRGFGSFGLNYRPARTGRTPKSGDAVPVCDIQIPHFTVGKELRERVEASAKHTPLQPAASDVAE